MCREECHMYKARGKSNLVCSRFNGDENNKGQISYCDKYCDYYDIKKKLNKEYIFVRIHGVLRRKLI